MIPDAQGLGNLESSIAGGARASRRGTGGVDDCGTAEEDGPVTWETPVCPAGGSGRRRTGDPLRRAVGSERSGGRLLGRRRSGSTEPTLAPLVGAAEGRPEGVPKRAGESDGCIRAMKVGNGDGTRTQRSKGSQC
jgi:hypothetical protein